MYPKPILNYLEGFSRSTSGCSLGHHEKIIIFPTQPPLLIARENLRKWAVKKSDNAWTRKSGDLQIQTQAHVWGFWNPQTTVKSAVACNTSVNIAVHVNSNNRRWREVTWLTQQSGVFLRNQMFKVETSLSVFETLWIRLPLERENCCDFRDWKIACMMHASGPNQLCASLADTYSMG